MTATYGPQYSESPYIPPEYEIPKDEKLFRELIEKRERLTATVVNLKENAQYEMVEVSTGQQWFSSPSSGAIVSKNTLRITFDLVALNGGVSVPIGATTYTLTATTQPRLIAIATGGSILPVNAFGAASNGTNFYFINDPLLFVRTNIWNSVTQQITITNNTGAVLTHCVWCMEYFKT